uniref:Zinc finger C2H2 LYAR-type domain-containing protein n=1 Tax=Ditylum brightwellii TaxID=49249 RepID=A0A7S1ZTJ5_9STRA|mmetsp:Transcript_38139/g.57072  ORF Transcript_38139/g.57072 Transcript_38139/m.57072 type:complete len:281 (+) Transcript_38139:101-943(+)
MVFFSCDGCGEMLKKNQVDNHVYKCPQGCYAVSCVDCSVSFPGDDYRKHTSCISEAERYEKTIYRGPRKNDPNAAKNKKLSPQEAWVALIADSAAAAPQSLKGYMDQIASLDNVPRKEKQFRNFTANSLRLRGPSGTKIVDEIWKFLSKLREEKRAEREAAQKLQKQQEEEEKAAAAEQKKESDESQNNDSDSTQSSTTKIKTSTQLSAKEIKKVVKKVLKKTPGHQMKFKKLRKEVQSKMALVKNDAMKKDLQKLMKQEITADSNKKLRLDGKVVILVS